MKKFLLFLVVVFFAYITAFYTAGKENGYQDSFDFSYLEQKISDLFKSDYNDSYLSNNHLQNGMDYLKTEEYYNALDEFYIALEEDYNAVNNYYIGYCYLMIEDYMNADTYLSRAIDSDPKFWEAYRDRGIAKYYQNYYEEAEKDLFFSTELNYEDPETYYYLSLCYEEQSQNEVALQSIETALKYDKENIDYWFKAAFLAYEVNKYDLSVKYYKSLLEIDSTHKFSFVNLGLNYAKQDKKDSAIIWYDKVLAIYPDYSLAYNNKAYVFQSDGDYLKAIELYTTAISFDTYDTRPVWNRGDCYFALGQFDNAITDYQNVYDMNSEYYNALFQIGECYEKKGQIIEALRFYMEYKTIASSESTYYDEVDKKIENLK